MRPLKIAVGVPIFPNTVQTYIISTLAGFRKLKLDFCVIAVVKKTYNQLPQAIEKDNLLSSTIYINPKLKNIFNELWSLPYFSGLYWQSVFAILTKTSAEYSIWYRLKSIFRARARIQYPFDVLHSHSLYVSHDYLFIKEVFNIPIVTTYHGQVPKGVERLSHEKLSLVLSEVDKFIVNTDFAQNELTELGCEQNKIEIIPQGIDLDEFIFSKHMILNSNKIKILTVGRLSLEKGHSVAIKAIAQLNIEYPQLEYHIVGNGPQEQHLKQLAQDLGIKERVIFHGFKTGHELKQLFADAHIFVLPSIDTGDGYLVETQGVVLQEAQATGLPVIGSRTGGIPDVINDNETGLLFDEENYRQLAEKITLLISKPDLYEKLSMSGRVDVEKNYDINIVCNKLVSLYKDIVNQ